MAIGTGIGFDYTKLSKAFDDLDAKLRALTAEGKNFETTMKNAFASMGKDDFKTFADKVAALKKDVVAFGKQKVGIQWDSKGLQEYINNINRLIFVINEIKKDAKGSHELKGTGVNILGLKKELKDAQELLRVVKQVEKEMAAKTKDKNQTYRGALAYSSRAKTLEQEIQAVKNLEAARAKLNTTTEGGKKKIDEINKRILQHNKNIKHATEGAEELEKAHSKLGSKIAMVFSVQAIRGYINKMIEVRGEMELQQRSLQAILQNKDAANEIWQQTIDLAIKSPFRIKDLVTYTKQLAAYRVESDKLYETNKMLADVSAGLGVDMNRLILAFGQVKAANFLRGTELRQFTEAGIPMLDELAKHFNDMNNTALTSADVFEMISKRMVLFEDVEAVFERMTKAGGTFYRMQEIQSETLRGQISNLKDSLDIMLNNMGKDMDGILKGSVKSVKFLVDNYQTLVPIIKALIASFALYRIQAFEASKATLRFARKMKLQQVSASGLSGMWTSLRVGLAQFYEGMVKTARLMASNPWLVGIAAFAALALEIRKVVKQFNEVDKAYNDMLNQQSEITSKFFKASDIDEQKRALKELIDYANKEYEFGLSVDLKPMSDDEVKAYMNDLRQKMINANAFGAEFQKELIEANLKTKWNFADWLTVGVGEHGLLKDIDQMGNSYDNLNRIMVNNLAPTIDLLSTKLASLSEDQRIALESLKAGIGEWEDEDEDMVAYFDRIQDNYKTLIHLLDESDNIADKKISRQIKKYQRRHDEARKEFQTFIDGIDQTVSNLNEEDKTVFLNAAIDDAKAEKNWSEFEETQIRKWLEEVYEIELTPKITTDPDNLKAWQKSYNDLFVGKTGFRKIGSLGISQKQVIEQLNAQYESTAELLERIQSAGEESVLAGGAYEGENLKKLKQDLADIKEQLDWFGVQDKRGGGSGKDEVLEKLKNRINLIKEMNKEYEKLNKTFSKAESLAKVQEAYANTAKELGLDTSTMDFTDEGTIGSLEALLGKPEYAANKYVIELEKALDNFKVELGVEVKQEKDKDLKAQVQELFDRYDLSVELKKLNIPSDLAKSLFDVDYLDLEGLKKAVQDQEVKFVGTDMEDEYKKFLEKIDDMERKSIVERTKTYAEYLTRGMNERVKLKVEELRKLKELEESKEFNPDQKEQIRGQIKADTQKALDKESWNQFQATDWYTMMFTDLETLGTQAIKNLHEELSQLKSSLSHLDPSEVKEIVSQMEKLQEQLIERNPFEAFVTARQNIKALAQSEDDIISQLKAHEDNEAYAQRMLDMLAEIEVARADANLGKLEGDTLALFQKLRAEVFAGNTDAFKNAKKEAEGLLEQAKSGKELTSEQLVIFANYRKSLQGVSNYWGEVNDKIQDIVSSAVDIMEVYGLSESSKVIAESVGNMSTLITQAVQFGIQMKVAGLAANTALGVIGWIAIAIQAIATVLSAIANYKNAKIDEQLEKQAKTIERQRDLYEQIEKKVESAYNVDQLRQYNKELERSVELEIQALEASIAMERSRKKADEEQIEEWQKEIIEARERLAESKQEMMEELGGMFDITDFTSGFVDAWWNAMDEGKRGLDALGEHFEETMKDMVKKQALYQGAKDIMKQVQDVINADLADDYDIDDWQKIWDVAKKANVDLDAFLQGWYDMFGGLSNGASGGLSALQKGIQGVSEETAQVIEAYLNSIRGYVSEQVTHTRNIYRILYDAVHSDAAAIRVRMI